MRFEKDYMPSLAGSLLIAHPALLDPNFRQSVILLSAHSVDQGGMGVVLNYPMGKTMGQFDFKYSMSTLANVPMYLGGPIGQHAIMLAAWEWLEHNSIFKLHFGISQEQAEKLLFADPQLIVRAFLGHTEWLKGQLEGELHRRSWFLSSIKNMLNSKEEGHLWKDLLMQVKPELLFLVDPENPSLN